MIRTGRSGNAAWSPTTDAGDIGAQARLGQASRVTAGIARQGPGTIASGVGIVKAQAETCSCTGRTFTGRQCPSFRTSLPQPPLSTPRCRRQRPVPHRPPGHREQVSCRLRHMGTCPNLVIGNDIHYQVVAPVDESQHTSPRHQAQVDRCDWLHLRDQEEPEKRPRPPRHPQVRPSDRPPRRVPRGAVTMKQAIHRTTIRSSSATARLTSPSSPGRPRPASAPSPGKTAIRIPSSTSRIRR